MNTLEKHSITRGQIDSFFLTVFGLTIVIGVPLLLLFPEHYLLVPFIPLFAIYAATVLVFHRFALYMAVLFVSIVYFFVRNVPVLPELSVVGDEITLAIVTAGWVLTKFRSTKQLWTFTPVDIPLFLFLAVGLVSIHVNHVNWGKGLFGIRLHAEYLLIFYAAVNCILTSRHRRNMILLILAVGLLQVPVALGQLLVNWNAIVTRGATGGDLIVGTMGHGGANFLGYFLLLCMGILLGLYEEEYRSARAILPLCLLLLIPFVLCSSRIAYPIFLVFLIWLFRKRIKLMQIRYALVVLLIIICTVCLGYAVFYKLFPEQAAGLSLRVNLHSEFDPSNVGRFAYYPICWDLLQKRSASPWIGTGPATFSSFAGMRFGAHLLQVIVVRQLMAEQIGSQLIATGVEYGYLGVLFYFGIIGAFLWIDVKMMRHSSDPFWRGVARGYLVGLLLYTLPTLIGNVWEVQYVSYFIWLIAGLLFRQGLVEGVFGKNHNISQQGEQPSIS